MSDAQLSFALGNPPNKTTIYKSTQPGGNKGLTLAISTNAAVTFAAGKPVDPSRAQTATGTLIYVDLTPLNLSATEFGNLKPSLHGWVSQGYTTGQRQVICLAPSAPASLAANASLAVKIAGFAISTPPSTDPTLVATYYRVGNIPLSLKTGVRSKFPVVLENPPSGKADLHNVLNLTIAPMDILTSIPDGDTVINTFTLTFAPASEDPEPVQAGPAAEFIVNLVYDTAPPGFGALTTVAAAKEFSKIVQVGGPQWKIGVAKEAQSPAWSLKPPAGPIFGDVSTMGFVFGNVVTQFAGGPTLATITYTGITGYADGSYSIVLQKIPHVTFTAPLTITPNPVALTENPTPPPNGTANVQLSWQVSDAARSVFLTPAYEDVTGLTSYTTTITDDTQMTLTATGADAGNQATSQATAQVLPLIDSFVADPSSIYKGDFPYDVTLSWNVDTGGKVKLSSSDPNGPSQTVDPISSLSAKITVPQLLTLAPIASLKTAASSKRLISAFDTVTTPQTLSAPAGGLAASPVAGFIAVSLTSNNAVAAVSTVTYKPITTVPVGNGPAGLAFTRDGSTLFVANSGGTNVSVVSVTPSPLAMRVSATIEVGGSPQQIALGPGDEYVYVTVSASTGPGTLVVLTKQDDGSYAKGDVVTIGTSPAGVAVLPSGARIFVANTVDGTVSVVGFNDGKHVLSRTLPNFALPTGVAVTDDGATLLVVCNGSAQVFSLDASVLAQRTPCRVGTGPSQIAADPNGRYFFVSNTVDDTVTMLGYDPNASTNVTSRATLPVGTGPGPIAAAGGGGLVVTGNTDGTLSVTQLTAYFASSDLKACSGAVSALVASPDASTVVAWYDQNISSEFATPMPGIAVYSVPADSIVQQLSGNVYGCAFVGPASGPRLAVAAKTSLSLVGLADFAPGQTIQLPDYGTNNTARIRNIAATADGSAITVFAGVSNGDYRVLVYTAGDDGTFPAAPEADVIAFTTQGSIFTLFAMSEDGGRIFVVDTLKAQLWTVERNNGSYGVASQPISVPAGTVAIAVSPDGTRLFLASRSQQLQTSFSAIDTAAQTIVSVTPSEYTPGVTVNGLAVSADGSQLFAADGGSAGFRVLDARTLQFVQTVTWQNEMVQFPRAILALSDGSQIVSANAASQNLSIAQLVQPQRALRSPRIDEAATASPAKAIFVRDTLGATPQNPGGASSSSPDIVFSQETPQTQAQLVASYSAQPSNTINPGVGNDIYLRGLNVDTVQRGARMWFWYTPGGDLALWPTNWKNTGMTVAVPGQPTPVQQNYVEIPDASGAQPGQVLATPIPIVWTPPDSTHYCGIVFAESPYATPAVDPRNSIGGFGSFTDLLNFILSTTNMGWCNTADASVTAPLITQTVTLTTPSGPPPYQALVGILCTNLPTDGTYALSVAGDGPLSTVTLVNQPIPYPNYQTAVELTFNKPNFAATVTISYFPGATKPPANPVPPGKNPNIMVVAGQPPGVTARAHPYLEHRLPKHMKKRVVLLDRETGEPTGEGNLHLFGAYTINLSGW